MLHTPLRQQTSRIVPTGQPTSVTLHSSPSVSRVHDRVHAVSTSVHTSLRQVGLVQVHTVVPLSSQMLVLSKLPQVSQFETISDPQDVFSVVLLQGCDSSPSVPAHDPLAHLNVVQLRVRVPVESQVSLKLPQPPKAPQVLTAPQSLPWFAGILAHMVPMHTPTLQSSVSWAQSGLVVHSLSLIHI